MSQTSTIEWTNATWNPTRGCTKISPGCTNCYAATFAKRFIGVEGSAYKEGFVPRLAPATWTLPLTWSQSKTIFVNSMSDLFHVDFADEAIQEIAKIMTVANWHTFQVLTKRSERMRDLLATTLNEQAKLPNIWWGVSVEDRRYGLPRIRHLQDSVAQVRFLSVEPLLEDLGELDLTGIHWVIVGGESGHHARPLNPDWVRSIRDQCEQAGVPFFFKQWGGRNKKQTGRILDGRTHDDMPAIERADVPSRVKRLQLIDQHRARTFATHSTRISLPVVRAKYGSDFAIT